MTTDLDAFRSVDFDWTRQLKSVWRDPPYHIPSLHRDQLEDLIDYFRTKTRDSHPMSEPLGRVVVGPAGYGKTHLIGELRRNVWEMGGWFVLLDFIGIKEFWTSVALGFLDSLQIRMPDGQTQYDHLLLKLVEQLGIRQEFVSIPKSTRRPQDLVNRLVDLFFRAVARKNRQTAVKHRDVLTALVLLISEDLDCHSVAHAWLQGMILDAESLRAHGLKECKRPDHIVEGLSWIMGLAGPTLIAVDQLDAIVSASNVLRRSDSSEMGDEQQEAQSIVEALCEGLMNLHERKYRAVTVLSCLEATWKVLEDRSTTAMSARYYPPMSLNAVESAEMANALVGARLAQAYQGCGFKPPYATWPFVDAAFESARDLPPRTILQRCEQHRQKCIADKKVTECSSLDLAQSDSRKRGEIVSDLSNRFLEEQTRAAIDIADLLDEKRESIFCDLLDSSLRLLQKHFDLPDDIDVEVQRDPDQKRPSLHGRLSFTFRSDGDREQHYCFRILGHTNALAFQSRLKAAMTASGIDRLLKFRSLFILRRGNAPGGAATKRLVAQFESSGGKFVVPTDGDLRAFVALKALSEANLPGFEAWLRQEKPLFKTLLLQAAGLAPPPIALAHNAVLKESAGSSNRSIQQSPPIPQTEAATEAKKLDGSAPLDSEARDIPLGYAYSKGRIGDPVSLAADLLPKHVAILAGSGSGKTVLLRRIIEEAALLGIPAIVLDINNDLSRLGLGWPAAPESAAPEDLAKAKSYLAIGDVVIWTPGAASGRPMSLKLLPDFAAIGDKDDPQTNDERSQAVEMARETLSPYIGANGAKGRLKHGVLASALRYFASSGGGSLDDLIRLLAELPEGVSDIGDPVKLAADMADQLKAAVATNPLLQAQGTTLDPRQLFHGPEGKTRISVINFSGLASQEARQTFVNQLQMALFTWIKQNPSRNGRLYVMDEAQNFVPSLHSTPCKGSAKSLVAQARKYGLGMIFATQLPKGIDNGIISNCTTHMIGRMSSPATIDAVREIMAARGGAAEDIGRLTRGEFYFSTDGTSRPFKIRTPLCLTWHPRNPPTADEVMTLARSGIKSP